MRIQTTATFPLDEVKPFARIEPYRRFCLEATRRALQGSASSRSTSPITGKPLQPFSDVDGLPYGRCPDSDSLFLQAWPDAARWAALLAEVSAYRHSPKAFHLGLSEKRASHVYAPKLEWIHDTLRRQGVRDARLLEVTTPPSDFTALLHESGEFPQVLTLDESRLAAGSLPEQGRIDAQAAVLLESLDRVHDPAVLVRAVHRQLTRDGLIFVTALVASGFDVAVLGARNRYLYPPDRANCFSLQGLTALLTATGFQLLEVSTPGVLDVSIVKAHAQADPDCRLSSFERRIVDADPETVEAFQAFLQQRGLSSFARIVGRKTT